MAYLLQNRVKKPALLQVGVALTSCEIHQRLSYMVATVTLYGPEIHGPVSRFQNILVQQSSVKSDSPPHNVRLFNKDYFLHTGNSSWQISKINAKRSIHAIYLWSRSAIFLLVVHNLGGIYLITHFKSTPHTHKN